MKFCEKIGIFLLVGVNFCWTMEHNPNRKWPSDKITLGEISLRDYRAHLPAIKLGHQENDGYNEWDRQQFYSWDKHVSLTPLDYTVKISNEHGDNFIPIVDEIGVPTVNRIPIEIPHIVAQTVWQPYPVLIPVTKPVPYEVVRYIIKHIEKKVPTPVEKIVPVPVAKHIPIQIERYQAVPVIKKFPIKIPILKTIVHRSRNVRKKNRH